MEQILVALAFLGSAILAAAAVVALLQLGRTLRRVKAFLEALSPRLERTLGIGRRSAPADPPEPGGSDA